MSRTTLTPITRDRARAWIKATHSHLPTGLTGWLCGVAVERDGQLVCVAALGRPKARLLAASEPRTAEITRIASNGTPHVASMAAAALVRAARALGYAKVITYTLASESGTCIKAAGFKRDDAHVSKGGEWSRGSRARAKALEPGPKVRWVRTLDGAQ